MASLEKNPLDYAMVGPKDGAGQDAMFNWEATIVGPPKVRAVALAVAVARPICAAEAATAVLQRDTFCP